MLRKTSGYFALVEAAASQVTSVQTWKAKYLAELNCKRKEGKTHSQVVASQELR